MSASAVAALCLVSPFTLSAPAQPAPPAEAPSAVEQAYVGTNQCFQCHRPQTNTWSETKHAQAFTDVPEKYRNDSACLKCHVTGFSQPGGFVAGAEKDLLMVGCEACHGPGARHIDAAQRFVMANPGEEAKIEQEMKDTIVKTPIDAVCSACHITQRHQRHPAYEAQPPAQAADGRPNYEGPQIAHAANDALVPCNTTLAIAHRGILTSDGHLPRYSVKTCGGCHYDQYKQWRAEKHFDLFAMLPVKHRNDPSCQACHPAAEVILTSGNTAGELHQNRIGVACESCHGPALEHVRFNRRFISAPPLGPKLEQAARDAIRKAKPASTCIQCHVGESHKEHPPLDG